MLKLTDVAHECASEGERKPFAVINGFEVVEAVTPAAKAGRRRSEERRAPAQSGAVAALNPYRTPWTAVKLTNKGQVRSTSVRKGKVCPWTLSMKRAGGSGAALERSHRKVRKRPRGWCVLRLQGVSQARGQAILHLR